MYADADEIELIRNGESVGKAAPHRFRAEPETTYQPGELTAVAYADGRKQGRTCLMSASGPLRLSASAIAPRWR